MANAGQADADLGSAARAANSELGAANVGLGLTCPSGGTEHGPEPVAEGESRQHGTAASHATPCMAAGQ